MKHTVTDIVMLFARARTSGHRHTALSIASTNLRFDEDQRRELQTLCQESRDAAQTMHVLRPLNNPAQDDPDLLTLTSDGVPVLAESVRLQVDEWVSGWNVEDGLRVNQCAPPGPLLLHGPTGSGKTTTARSLVEYLRGRPAVVLECHRSLDSLLGATGTKLNRAFESCAKTNALLVIEEIDGLADLRSMDASAASRESNRIVIALMRLIESSQFPVVATTNRLTALDSALLRRFEFKVELEAPPVERRRIILQNILDAEVPAALLALELNDSVPKARRLKRLRVMARLNI